jgi:hypothetical protein
MERRLLLIYIMLMLCASVTCAIIYLEKTRPVEIIIPQTCEDTTSLKTQITVLEAEVTRLEDENQILGSCCAQNEILEQ